MELVILSLLAAALLVLWSLCLSRLSCPWQTRRERRAIEGPTHPTRVEQRWPLESLGDAVRMHLPA
jgi:hypothetical protein